MTIQVELNPELGARLAAQARAQGMPLERARAAVASQASSGTTDIEGFGGVS